MWHHPSPWMLVFVAVDCKVSLLGIAGQASHLGSFTFPPGLDMGKIKLKVSKITILDRAFLAPLLLNDCLGQRGMILGFIPILHPIQSNIVPFCHYPAMRLPACAHCMRVHWHLKTSLGDSAAACTDVHADLHQESLFSLYQYFSALRVMTQAPGVTLLQP